MRVMSESERAQPESQRGAAPDDPSGAAHTPTKHIKRCAKGLRPHTSKTEANQASLGERSFGWFC